MLTTNLVNPVHFPVMKFALSFVSLFPKKEIVIIVHNVLSHESLRFAACITGSVLKMTYRLIVQATIIQIS